MVQMIYRHPEEAEQAGWLIGRALVLVYLPFLLIVVSGTIGLGFLPQFPLMRTADLYAYSMVAFTLALMVFLVWRWRTVKGTGTVVLFGATFGVLFGMTWSVIELVRDPAIPRTQVLELVVGGFFLGSMGFTLWLTAGWLLFRLVFWMLGYRLVEVAPGQCSGCGYDLRGNKSMVCPECGRAFSFAELGVTAEEFRGLGERVE